MLHLTKAILKSGKERAVQRFHPWIFSGAIKGIIGDVDEGDMIEVYDNHNQYLATGHYQIGSITIRLFDFAKNIPDRDFWKRKILNSIQLRKQIALFGSTHTNVLRLINGEGDGFPGLVIDYYNGVCVLQSHSIGMYLLREMFTDILKEIFGNQLIAVYDKSAATIPFKAASVKHENEFLYGQTSEIEVLEYGNRYIIDIEDGQKTGFFIDQRENRKLLETYAKNKHLLNVFSYTGGFSVAGLRGDAQRVVSVDSSQKAIAIANKNIELNFGETDRHQSFAVDAFKYLETIDNQFDVIVLDPPAFAKHNDSLDHATKGYRNINRAALQSIKKEGFLFTFSCSQVVSKELFRETVFSAAALAKRDIKVIHQLSQPADHPISIFHPEGDYLKGLVLFVTD